MIFCRHDFYENHIHNLDPCTKVVFTTCKKCGKTKEKEFEAHEFGEWERLEGVMVTKTGWLATEHPQIGDELHRQVCKKCGYTIKRWM